MEADGPPLYVQAIFSEHRPLTKGTVSDIARKLTTFLLEHAPQVGLYDSINYEYSRYYEDTPYLTSLSATRVPTHDHGVWYGAQGGWVARASHLEIQKAVDLKESRVTLYKTKAKDNWLLIVFVLSGNDTYVAAWGFVGDCASCFWARKRQSLDRPVCTGFRSPVRRSVAWRFTQPVGARALEVARARVHDGSGHHWRILPNHFGGDGDWGCFSREPGRTGIS